MPVKPAKTIIAASSQAMVPSGTLTTQTDAAVVPLTVGEWLRRGYDRPRDGHAPARYWVRYWPKGFSTPSQRQAGTPVDPMAR